LAAENLKGLVSFGSINCDEEDNKPLCGYFEVQSLPTVLAFKSSLEPIEMEGQQGFTKKPVKYEGPLKPAALAKWASTYLSEPIDAVIDVTNDKLSAFVEFDRVAKKAIVFTDKEKKSNLLRAVALNYRVDFLAKQWIPIGLVRNTESEIISKYKITSYPSLIIINEAGEVVDTYTGQYTVKELGGFLEKHAHVPTEEDLQQGPSHKKKPSQKASPPPPPAKKKEQKLHHVTDQESFDSACYQMGLCLIAFLDSESEDHQKYIDTLNVIVKKYASVQVMWLEGNKHMNFKSAFGVADYLPQAVAYQRKAKRYRIFTAGFEKELLSEFLDLVQAGTSKKARIATLDKEPAVGNEDDTHEEL